MLMRPTSFAHFQKPRAGADTLFPLMRTGLGYTVPAIPVCFHPRLRSQLRWNHRALTPAVLAAQTVLIVAPNQRRRRHVGPASTRLRREARLLMTIGDSR